MPPAPASRVAAVLLPLLLAAAAAPAADWGRAGGAALELAQSRGREAQGISLDEAVARVRRQSGGTVLSARARGHGANALYLVKVLTPDGHVIVYRVDARSGRVGR